MKHLIWFDEKKGILREKLVGSFTEDDVAEYVELMKRIYSNCNHAHVMVDVSQARQPFYDSWTRQALLEQSGKLHYFDEKVAFLHADPDIRIRIIELVETLRLRGKPLRINFFNSEDRALKWLKDN